VGNPFIENQWKRFSGSSNLSKILGILPLNEQVGTQHCNSSFGGATPCHEISAIPCAADAILRVFLPTGGTETAAGRSHAGGKMTPCP